MDRREKDLRETNDFGWVRALDASGNSIKINKADMAKVLGGLLERRLTDEGVNIELAVGEEKRVGGRGLILIAASLNGWASNLILTPMAESPSNAIVFVHSADRDFGISDEATFRVRYDGHNTYIKNNAVRSVTFKIRGISYC